MYMQKHTEVLDATSREPGHMMSFISSLVFLEGFIFNNGMMLSVSLLSVHVPVEASQ